MSDATTCGCEQKPEKPIINFPVKGVDLGVNVEAMRELLCGEGGAPASGPLFSSLEEVRVEGPVTLLSVSRPVHKVRVPAAKLEGRIIRLDFSFSVEGDLTAKPSCLWINRGDGEPQFISWYPTANQLSGYVTAYMKYKDEVLTLLHSGNLPNPHGCVNTVEDNSRYVGTEEIEFELACAPKQETGALVFHHMTLSVL